MTTVAVVCSPNMGIVDSWLPVVAAVHDQHPDWRLVAIVPRAWGVGIRPEASALRALDDLVEAVIVEILPGEYRRVEGFDEAVAVRARPMQVAERLQHLEGRLSRRGMLPVRLLRTLVRTVAPLVRGGSRQRWRRIDRPTLVLLDADVVARIEISELLRALGDPPTLSLSHGLGFPDLTADLAAATGNGAAKGAAAGADVAGRPTVSLAYAYSATHREVLRQHPAIPADRVRITGVPRHDPEGPRAVRDAAVGADWDGAVLLISRPPTSAAAQPATPADWLPAGRKAGLLRAIHRVVCEEQGLRLIVTMHPKERDGRSIRDTLPAEDEGRTWMLTETHPLALAPRLRFAISFSSGVAVDLLSAGVATIELQDVRGASAFDRPDALRDAEGRILRTSERRNGLVLAADDEADLRSQVRRVVEERDDVVTALQAVYRARYADPRGAVARIVRDLEELAAGRVPTIGGPDGDH